MSYGGYVEKLTLTPFLKMADERSRPPHSQATQARASPRPPAALPGRSTSIRAKSMR